MGKSNKTRRNTNPNLLGPTLFEFASLEFASKSWADKASEIKTGGVLAGGIIAAGGPEIAPIVSFEKFRSRMTAQSLEHSTQAQSSKDSNSPRAVNQAGSSQADNSPVASSLARALRRQRFQRLRRLRRQRLQRLSEKAKARARQRLTSQTCQSPQLTVHRFQASQAHLPPTA